MPRMNNIEEHMIDSTPCWLKALVERIIESIQPINPIGKLGYRYTQSEDADDPETWFVHIFPSPNEAFGGCHDGERIFPGFTLHLSHLLDAFTSVGELVWKSTTVYNEELDGPEFLLQGDFAGNAVVVRIFAYPPRDEKPS